MRKLSDAIRVEHVMTPRNRFEYCKPNDLTEPKLAIMRERNFDVLPMMLGEDLENDHFDKYVTQENMESTGTQGLKFCKDVATDIEEEDLMYENLTIEGAILRFSCRKHKPKIPFFLVDTNHKTTGLVTLADLDKSPVKVYLFALMSELELSFLEIVSKNFESFRETCGCGYCTKNRKNREGKENSSDRLEDYYYLYFKEVIHMIVKSKAFPEEKKQVQDILARVDCERIVQLRNTIVHPKPLVSDKFPINELDETLSLVKELISACEHE